VHVVDDEPNFLLLRVNNAKNMIIENEGLWEDADINLVIIYKKDGIKLVSVIDGRWSAGILAPKSAEAFRDMEPRYAKHLGDFAGKLLIQIKDELRAPKDSKKPK
jgi:hypothetical protein